jgi:HD-GYP domain-containing protein (c-di-GMP phosphodiesterase class II)
MSIADVYDALVDNRVYRRGMTHSDARAIIADGSGKNFDERIVESFLEMESVFEKKARGAVHGA